MTDHDQSSPPSPDDLLTIAEAADLLSVSTVTVSRWRRQGRLPTLKVGPRAVRIRRADLEGLGRHYSGPASSLGTPSHPAAARSADDDVLSGPTDPDSILSRAVRLRQNILARRNGEYLPAAGDLIARGKRKGAGKHRSQKVKS